MPPRQEFDARKIRLRLAFEVTDIRLSDADYWRIICELADIEDGDAFDIVLDDPAYYGFEVE